MENIIEAVTISWSAPDRLFYINRNKETIHSQKTLPNQMELIEALQSDNWTARFVDMREGKRVRVSDRIYWHMLECVPPIKQNGNSFYNGEAYSGGSYYYFETKDGKRYGELRPLK